MRIPDVLKAVSIWVPEMLKDTGHVVVAELVIDQEQNAKLPIPIGQTFVLVFK